MLKSQNKMCAICFGKLKSGMHGYSIDHCHNTNKIRGILCSPCNLALGGFQDDPTILKNAIKYLEK